MCDDLFCSAAAGAACVLAANDIAMSFVNTEIYRKCY
jgi:hypothetical protein